MLRGKERKKRKKEQLCIVKQRQMKKTYTLKINCKGKRTVGKTNKGINVKKQVHDIKIIRNRKEKKWKKKGKRGKNIKKGKLHRTAKAQCRGRGLQQ